MYNKRLLTVEESVHVSFDKSYPKNVGKGISLDGASVSTEDILKETVEEIGQSKTIDDEEEKYTSHTKDEEEEPT